MKCDRPQGRATRSSSPATRKSKAAKLSGAARIRIGNELGVSKTDGFEFCWIIDFPMYEWNEDEKKIDFSHNPFSMPQGGLEALMSKGPLEIKAFQYDIVCNGLELSSGAIRNHRPDIMRKAFEIAGYGAEMLEERFGGMYRAFQCGAPPHGGIAPGVDRIVMLLAGEENLREVVLFPMNQRAEDLMMGAPSPATAKQLRELHIRLACRRSEPMFEGFAWCTVEVDKGIAIACVSRGSGPPVLLLHGFPQTQAMWARIAPRIAEAGCSVVCADLRGYGDSAKPQSLPDRSNYSFRAMAEEQVRLMQALGHQRFHVIGHDRGARTAHRMALDHAHAVRIVAVLDIVPSWAMFMETNRKVASAYWHWYFLSQPEPLPERLIGADPDFFYETCLAGSTRRVLPVSGSWVCRISTSSSSRSTAARGATPQ